MIIYPIMQFILISFIVFYSVIQSFRYLFPATTIRCRNGLYSLIKRKHPVKVATLNKVACGGGCTACSGCGLSTLRRQVRALPLR